jgi:hypothetical protein
VVTVAIAIFHSGGAAAAFLHTMMGIVGEILGYAAQATSYIITNFAAGVGVGSGISVSTVGQITAGLYSVGALASQFAQTQDKRRRKKKSNNEEGKGILFCYSGKTKVFFKSSDSLPSEAKDAIREAVYKEGIIRVRGVPGAVMSNTILPDLFWLANNESQGVVGVRNHAGSTARGLFQLTAVNYKFNPNGEDSFGNAVEEAQGGIKYIISRYGSPSKAVAFWKKNCYY